MIRERFSMKIYKFEFLIKVFLFHQLWKKVKIF